MPIQNLPELQNVFLKNNGHNLKVTIFDFAFRELYNCKQVCNLPRCQFSKERKPRNFFFFFFAHSFAIGDVHLPIPHSDLALVDKLHK